MHSKPLLLLAAAVFAAPSFTHAQGTELSGTPNYTVVYTGRLFGYFRYPDLQKKTDLAGIALPGCPSFDEQKQSNAVRAFRSQVNEIAASASSPLLVGMGDNFGPEFPARAMQIDGALRDKDLYAPSDDAMSWIAYEKAPRAVNLGTVPTDNVGCFLRAAHFQAIVPGQHDFYFGAERVRELARFLALPADSSGNYQPVQMLAANLTIVTKLSNAAPRLPDEKLPNKIKAVLKPIEGITVSVPTAVMPWLHQLTIQGKSLDGVTAYDCLAADHDPNDFEPPHFDPDKHLLVDPSCTSLAAGASRSDGSRGFEVVRRPSSSADSLPYYVLDPGSNHAFCIVKDSKVHCQRFTVRYPFFQFNPRTTGATPAPYYLSHAHDSASAVAVFGVLDPDLATYIGALNDIWLNTHPGYETSIQIADPIETLRQQLQLCNQDQACRSARKVLLAQMPYYKASQLASKLYGFDIVIAQSDAEHASREESLTRSMENKETARMSESLQHPDQGAAFVLTPGAPMQPSDQLQPSGQALEGGLAADMRQATLRFQATGAGERRFLTNHVFRRDIVPVQNPELKSELKALESRAQKPFPQITLEALASACHSDISLIQKRDIYPSYLNSIAYWPPVEGGYTDQSLLEEVIWKGDFITCVPLKGSTIKKMLNDSDAFAKQDRDQLSPVLERNRELETLGIDKDQVSKASLVRGEQIDDAKLYSVGMTDYILFGDTGYPEVASEALPPPDRPTSVKILKRLAAVACHEIPAATGCETQSAENLNARNYFDYTNQVPSDTTRGNSPMRQLPRAIWNLFGQNTPEETLFAEFRLNGEQRPETHQGLWWFSLQNLSTEYDLTFIRGSDSTIPVKFSGINTFSQLSTPESSKLALWGRARGGYSFPKLLDFYAGGETKYTRAALRQSDTARDGGFDGYQVTLKDNIVRGEVGMLSKPISTHVPVRILSSWNLLTQFYDPFAQFSLPEYCSSANCPGGLPGTPPRTLATFDLMKNYLVMYRIGARIENEKNWLETGYETGENFGIPVKYTFQNPTAAPLVCTLSNTVSLAACVNSATTLTAQSTLSPTLINQHASGYFFNFHIVLPLYPAGLQLTADNYGELFVRRPDDLAVNTRFYDDLTIALKFPIWANLSVAPQVELFDYQNKVVANHYTYVTSSIRLDYNFDWHRGERLIRAMRYPSASSSAASTLPPHP